MKKFELLLGIFMIVITTSLDILFPMIVPFSASNLALICILSAIGYMTGYLLVDSHICRVETHYYVKGYNDGLEDAHLNK
jgi:hypothetical protein